MTLNSNEVFLEPSFDSVHGLSLEDPAGPLALYYNRERYYRYLRKCSFFGFVILSGAAYLVQWALLHDLYRNAAIPNGTLFVCVLSAIVLSMVYTAFLVSRVRSKTESETRPIVELTVQGLTTRLRYRNFEQVPWKCIRSARVKKQLGTYVCVNLIDSDKIDQFVSKVLDGKMQDPETLLLLRAEKFYSPFNRDNELLKIPEIFLPVDAELLAEQINMRCGGSAKLLIDEDGSGVSQF